MAIKTKCCEFYLHYWVLNFMLRRATTASVFAKQTNRLNMKNLQKHRYRSVNTLKILYSYSIWNIYRIIVLLYLFISFRINLYTNFSMKLTTHCYIHNRFSYMSKNQPWNFANLSFLCIYFEANFIQNR